MEAQIHQLEQEAYLAVLKAFNAQADAVSWENQELIDKLREELRVSSDEHREFLSMVSKDDTIVRIRNWRRISGLQVTNSTFLDSRKKQKTFTSYHSFNSPRVTETPEALIGRKVWIRWPDDNRYYEAIITQYNAADGRHVLVYDQGTVNETLEWVDLNEIPPEDIRWDGVNSRVPLNNVRGGGSFRGRGRGPRNYQPRRELLPPPAQRNYGRQRITSSDDIELLNTDSLVKEVEKVFFSTRPDPVELDKAKKVLKEHEQALLAAIAKLDDIDGEPPNPQGR